MTPKYKLLRKEEKLDRRPESSRFKYPGWNPEGQAEIMSLIAEEGALGYRGCGERGPWKTTLTQKQSPLCRKQTPSKQAQA